MTTQRCIRCRDTLRVTHGRLRLPRAHRKDPAPPTRRQRRLHRVHQPRRPAARSPRGPGWGEALIRVLTRRGVIRYFLQRTWGAPTIDEAIWEYDVFTTSQPDAEHAPLHFLSGGLFSADIHSVYEKLALPVWMSHGVRGDFTDYRGASIVAGRPNWRFSVFPTGALPHFEVPGEFVAACDAFLEGGSERTL